MKTIINLAFAVAIATLIGCNRDAKKSDESGPRITSGKVDESIKPQKPSLGGKMQDGK
jgi:hypothetical protein